MRGALLKLHISVIIAGFTGVLGKMILLPEGPLVWYRLVLTTALIAVWLRWSGHGVAVPLREAMRMISVGLLLGLHWLFFYGSIKYANVSIGVVCFSLTGFFTAFLEPLFSHRRISLREILFSSAAVAGIMLIFHLDTRYRTGIILGAVSSAFCALFVIRNKQVGKNHDSRTMLTYVMTGGLLGVSLVMPGYLALFPESVMAPALSDLAYLALLSSVCTIGLFVLQIQALKDLSAFTVNLTYNLEPIYSIVLAMVFLGEINELNISFYAGLGLITLSVVLQTLYALRRKPAFCKA